MTNQSFVSENTRRNITWAEVAKIFHLEHLGQKHTVEPVTENKKPPEEMSDAELVASLNRVYNPAEIEAALIAEEEEDAPDSELSKYYPAPYYAKYNCLGYVKHTKDGEVEVQLCNFAPRISCEILYDDGEEVTREYEITVRDENGLDLPTFRVPASSFGKLDWVGEKLPARCRLDVTGSVEKHIVNAMKGSSAHADLRSIYAHTGWVKQDGEYRFLLPGNPLCEVELEGKHANYGMVAETRESDLSYLVGMLELTFVPYDVMYPLLSMVFLSPLNSFLRQAGYEPKFVFTLIGRTGSKKSTLSALMLSFFGQFTELSMPMSFADTPNSILYAVSHLDDVLTCVDDSHPSTKNDVDNMNLIAEKLVRGYGDRAQRNRLTSEISMRKTRPPQGNAIMTMEFVPAIGESSLARTFCIETTPESIDLKVLQDVQDHARDGVLQRCMYSFLCWEKESYLADGKDEAFIASLRESFAEARWMWRNRLTAGKIIFHDRLPDTLACLTLGFRMLLRFLLDRKMLTEDQRQKRLAEFLTILTEHARKQSVAVVADKPTHVFLRNLFAMVDGGMVSITDREKPKIGNTVVGYEDDTYYYLLLDKSIGEVKRFCENTNQTFTLSSKALTKQLKEEGLLVPFGASNSDSIKVLKKNVRVTRLRRAEVLKILSTLD
ncbi:MAG: hypothetical protein E7576_11300 [Ruminococcaceae bacterium]|nr:hypothetical protein [Oscillospiraceae bacterium]